MNDHVGVALTFERGVDTDPATPLSSWLEEWVVLNASRLSAATTRGYLSDAAQFFTAHAQLHRPEDFGDAGADQDGDEDEGRAGALPGHLQRIPDLASPYLRAQRAMSRLDLEDLNPRLLAVTFDQLGVDRSPASTLRLVSAVSSYCQLLVRRGVLAANPTRDDVVHRPRPDQDLPRVLGTGEVDLLLATLLIPDPNARRPWPERDLALAAVLLSTGARVNEIRSAAVGDLARTGAGPSLRVLGKGRRTRVLPLTDEVTGVLDRYLLSRQQLHGQAPAANDPLFVRWSGTMFSDRAMRRLVDRWYVRAGIRKLPGASVHLLRHTFATQALDSGSSVIEVQAALGHLHLDTTRRYLHVSADGTRQLAEHHPVRLALRTLDTGADRSGHPAVADIGEIVKPVERQHVSAAGRGTRGSAGTPGGGTVAGEGDHHGRKEEQEQEVVVQQGVHP